MAKVIHTVLSTAIALAVVDVSNANEQDEKNKIEEITVSSRLPDSASVLGTSFSVVTEQEILASGRESLTDILITEPGIGVSRNGGIGSISTVRIRGEEGFRTQLRVDGVLIADPTAPQISPVFGDVSTSGIERVEILRGPQGAIYGADAGGVISVTSKRYQKPLGGSVDLKVGSDDLQRFSGNVGGSSDLGHFFASYSNLDLDGFNVSEFDGSGEEDGYDNETFHVNGQLNVTDQVSISGLYRKHEGENEFDGCFSFDGSFNFIISQDCSSENDLDIASVAVDFESDVTTQRLSYSKTDVQRDSFTNGVLSFGTEGEIDLVEYLSSYQLSDNQRVIIGAEWREESDNTNERNQRAVFVNYQTEIVSGWFGDVSARYDDTDDFGSFDNYRIATSYLFPQTGHGQWRVKANYGTGVRIPSIFEQSFNNALRFSFNSASPFSPAAESQLSEETSEGYDVGVEWVSANDWRASVTWFDQEIDDTIEFDSASSRYLQTAGTSQSQGVELEFDWLIAKLVNLGVNYTYNDTEDTQGEQRLRRPEKIANVSVGINVLSNLSVNMVLRTVRDVVDTGSVIFAEDTGIVDFSVEPDNVDLDDYETLDVTVNYAVSPEFDVYANMYNLLDDDYQEVNSFNNAGLIFSVGGRYQF